MQSPLYITVLIDECVPYVIFKIFLVFNDITKVWTKMFGLKFTFIEGLLENVRVYAGICIL